jgi:hypothetical protein
MLLLFFYILFRKIRYSTRHFRFADRQVHPGTAHRGQLGCVACLLKWDTGSRYRPGYLATGLKLLPKVTIDLHRATAPKVVVNHRLSSAKDINPGGDVKSRYLGSEKKGRTRKEISHDGPNPQICTSALSQSPSPDVLDLPLPPSRSLRKAHLIIGSWSPRAWIGLIIHRSPFASRDKFLFVF